MRAPLFGIGTGLALAVFSLVAACIQQTCVIDDDCGGDKVCLGGTCAEPECETEADCSDGQVCFQHRCAESCGDGAAAPAFCADDRNPRSDRYGQEICVGGEAGATTVLFFGTITCGVCRTLFSQLDEMADGLQAEGVDALAVFVQYASTEASPTDVEEAFTSAVGSPVVQDSASLGIWEGYGASQYDVALVGADGCVLAYYDQVTIDGLDGTTGQQLEEAWREALGL